MEGLGPDDSGAARLCQLDADGEAGVLRPHRSADDVVHVEDPPRLLCTHASLVQLEHRPLRDDEQTAQLGQPGDHVVRQRVCGAAAGEYRGGVIDEGHDRDRAAPWRGSDAWIATFSGVAAFDRDDAYRPRRVPGVAKRSAVETFGFE